MRRLVLAALVVSACLAAPPRAEATPCRLALVLALDVSASVDASEYELLRSGTAAALSSPAVSAAIRALGGVHVAAFEWSGRSRQRLVQDWRHLDGEEAIAAVAERIAGHARSSAEYPTALGSALGYAQRLMARAPAPCERRVVDIAGDGENNHGFGPGNAYRAFDFGGITVNGLVVAGASEAAVDYYRNHVVRGPGAFLEIADGYGAFEETMRRKLLREIGLMGLSDAREVMRAAEERARAGPAAVARRALSR